MNWIFCTYIVFIDSRHRLLARDSSTRRRGATDTAALTLAPGGQAHFKSSLAGWTEHRHGQAGLASCRRRGFAGGLVAGMNTHFNDQTSKVPSRGEMGVIIAAAHPGVEKH